jgi:hypothetical protein
MLGWLNWRSTSFPTQMINEGKFVSSIQCEYYINKVHTISQELPQSKTGPLETDLTDLTDLIIGIISQHILTLFNKKM